MRIFTRTHVARTQVLIGVLWFCFQSALLPLQTGANEHSLHKPKRVVVIYSIFGMGHLTAARAVSSELLRAHPETEMILKSVDDFRPQWRTDLNLAVYGAVIKNFPWVYDWVYHHLMKNMREGGLDAAFEHVESKPLLEFLETTQPDAVITTHQGTGVLLAKLRKAGFLPQEKVKIGMVWTDFFVETNPKYVSSELDHTWVPHPVLKNEFLLQGLPENAVTTSGMPLTEEVSQFLRQTQQAEIEGTHGLEARSSFLTAQGLNPETLTITLASGNEGVGDYPALIDSLIGAFFRKHQRPLQIVAVCARNQAHFQTLTSLSESIERLPSAERPPVTLKVLGFIPQADLLQYIKYSDLYITKSGGLSPPEGFAMNRPMILLDVYGGHERVNASFFKKLGTALINKNPHEIGEQAVWLLSDRQRAVKRRLKMSRAQKHFTVLQNLGGISEFVFAPMDGV